MRDRSVLVCGGGSAGPTAAFSLARQGGPVTVVEREAGTRSSGNPVDVRAGAAAVSGRMGIWPRLQEAAAGVERLVFVDAGGRAQASIPTRQGRGRTGQVEVARHELLDLLLARAREDCRIIADDPMTSLQQDPAGVVVEVHRSPARRFDLVVGAVGIHSTVRALAFGPAEGFTRPLGMFVGTVPAPVLIADPATVLMYNEPGTSLALHPAAGMPGYAFIFRGRHAVDCRDAELGVRLVESAYAGSGWYTAGALQAWRAPRERYFDAVSRVDVPQWAAGRVVLLGDAASCVSLFGEGSSNAIVGAKSLADALAAHPEDHTAAFAAYEHTPQTRPGPATACCHGLAAPRSGDPVGHDDAQSDVARTFVSQQFVNGSRNLHPVAEPAFPGATAGRTSRCPDLQREPARASIPAPIP